MTAFHDVSFPFAVGLSARGGPERLTEIVELASGREERNAPRAHSRRRWDAGPGVKTRDDLSALVDFFEERRGRLHAFRFRDPLDHRSCRPSQTPTAIDQEIGTGDGAETVFPLIKRYGSGSGAYDRPIAKPVAGTVLVAVDGVAAGFSLDAQGRVILDVPAPAGAAVTAGFEFDTPARFDSDRLDITLEGFEAGEVPSVPLVEVRL